MANRRDIRTALFEDLKSIVGNRAKVTANYTKAQQTPASVYYDGSERDVYEGVGDQIVEVRDDQDRVIREIYVDHYQYVADVSIMVDDDTLEEEIYSDVKKGLKKWTHGGWPNKDFHNHCESFDVSDMSDATSTDVYSIMRGDTIQATIGYVSGIPKDVEFIEAINGGIDVGQTETDLDDISDRDSSA